MSHFGRSGPPDIKDTFSLLVLNITFRTLNSGLFFIVLLFLLFLFNSTDIRLMWLLHVSLLGTSADDLYPLFIKYGKVVDIFIPRDRRYLEISNLSIYDLVIFFLLRFVDGFDLIFG